MPPSFPTRGSSGRVGDPVPRGVLVAQELGHSELHAGFATCSKADIDPSRSMEAAPVGLQSVEDYGARERRELQANVYARELVLPRAFARALHLEQNLAAATICERTKLPVALVDRKSVVVGKRVSLRVILGGGRRIK